jgi:cellobiose-specific phosphotransferase system component IIC
MMMSDYEMFSTFSEIVTIMNTVLMDYVAILFAFLVAAFFVASKLKQSMIAVVVSLFSVFVVFKLYESIVWALDLSRLQGAMGAALDQGDSNLNWLGFATYGSESFLNLGTWIIPAIIIFGYIASLIFFFHQRHQGLKAS